MVRYDRHPDRPAHAGLTFADARTRRTAGPRHTARHPPYGSYPTIGTEAPPNGPSAGEDREGTLVLTEALV